LTPLFGIAAAWLLMIGSRTYQRDIEQAAKPLVDDASLPDLELVPSR
jgi:MFS transporter, Spinster family, sphingosine-1-phosphate transporter